MALHPSLDILVTAGRDSTARVWDMRTKANVHTLVGHTNTVASVICQSLEPQVIIFYILFLYYLISLLVSFIQIL
jgi:pleiotropic regulator 1